MRGTKSSRKKKVSTIDPFCNISSRRQIIKTKANQLNNPPDKAADDQPMSQKLKDLIKAMEPIKRKKAGLKPIKRPPQDVKDDDDGKGEEPISKKARKRKKAMTEQHKLNKVQSKASDQEEKLSRLSGESDKKFLRRVRTQSNMDVRNQMDEINLLGKHEEDIPGLIGEKKASEKDKQRLNKLHERKKRKKFEKNLDKLEEEFFVDKVEFGEVSQRPPELSFQPRKSQPSNTAGQRKLLLTSIMNTADKPKPITSSHAAKGGVQKRTKKKDKIKKRKDMNKAEKRQFDAMRDDAISAYRKIRAKNMAERTGTVKL